MNNIETIGNFIEAGVWLVFSCIFFVQYLRSVDKLRLAFRLLAIAFFLFSISDMIESQTGAWWRPWWLLVFKASCVGLIVFGFRSYYRTAR